MTREAQIWTARAGTQCANLHDKKPAGNSRCFCFQPCPPLHPPFQIPPKPFPFIRSVCVKQTKAREHHLIEMRVLFLSRTNSGSLHCLFKVLFFFKDLFKVRAPATCSESGPVLSTRRKARELVGVLVSSLSPLPTSPPLPLLIFSFPPPALSRQTVSPLHSILFSPSPALSFPLSCLLLPFLPVAFHLSPSLPSTLPLHPFTPTQARAARQRTSPTLSTLLLLHSSLAAPRSHPSPCPPLEAKKLDLLRYIS